MKDADAFLDAYRTFRNSVDFTKQGLLPDMEGLIWSFLAGVPHVPADEDHSKDGALIAVDQRATILKAVFVEVNGMQPEHFLDQGLTRYDTAAKTAKTLLDESLTAT